MQSVPRRVRGPLPSNTFTRKAAADDPGMLESLMASIGGYDRKQMGKAFGSGKAGSPGFLNRAAAFAGRNKVPLAGTALLASALGAAGEFDGEGLGTDTSQATGRFLADLATTGGLAALGTVIAPGVGTVALPLVASMLGVQKGAGQAGANIGENIYNAITGTEGDKQRKDYAKNERLKTQLAMERLSQVLPLQEKFAEMADARAINMARQNMINQRDYNFGNTLDAATLLGQQNFANQLLMNQQTLY